MRKRLRVAAIAAGVFALGGLPASAAPGGAIGTHLSDTASAASQILHHAQFTIQLGGGKQAAIRTLRRQGYTDIRIVRSGLTKTIAEACQGGDRIRIVMNALGGIRDSGKIGECAAASDPSPDYDNLRLALRDQGYRRIEFTGERRGRAAEATACRDGREFLVLIRPNGRIRSAERTGRRCGPVVNVENIRKKLRDEGFNRIEFTNTEPPVIRAEACNRRNRRVSLRLNARGDIRQAARVGRCPRQRPELSIAQIGDALKADGFDRIEFTDRRLPGYVAEACRRDVKIRLRLNRFGEVRREERIGRCPVEQSLPQIRQALQDRGYNRIRFTDRKLPIYVAEACNRRNRKIEIRLNRFGQIRDERRAGRCASEQSVAQITRALEGKGYDRIKFTDSRLPRYVAEVCDSRNRKFELTLSRYGETVDEKRAGNCREALRPRQIRQSLEDKGYDRIRFTDRELPGYEVEACQRRDRVRIALNRFGDIRRETNIGRCRAGNAQNEPDDGMRDYRQALRRQGYSQISFTDKQLPGIVAEACKNNRRFRVRMNRRARIRREVQVGRCVAEDTRSDVTPRDIRRALRARGFNRIKFTDRNPPTIVAEACRQGQEFELKFDGRGRLTDRNRVGRFSRRCDADRGEGLTVREVEERLEQRRYYNVSFTNRGPRRYAAEACRNGNKFELRMNRYGSIRSRRRIGFCPRPGRAIASRPIVRFTDRELEGRDAISADTCQDYVEYLLFRDTVLFDVASATITEDSRPLLNRLASVLNRCNDASVLVAGHTDSDGSASSNQRLSERRAAAVRAYLIDRGVRARRLNAEGYGEERPAVPNTNSANKALNRRIEFVMNWDAS